MPTSSQYLILKAHDGSLPPIFGHRRWRPEFSLPQFPVTSVDFTAQSMHVPTPRRSYAFPYSPRRPGSAPNIQLHSAVLPDILKIHRLHGALRYDIESNSLHWHVPSQDIEQFRDVNRGWTPGTIRAHKLTFRRDDNTQKVHTIGAMDKSASKIGAMDISASDILKFMPKSGKTTKFAELEKSGDHVASPRNATLVNHESTRRFVKVQEMNVANAELITTDAATAGYFKIIRQPYGANSANGSLSTFRLVTSNIDEPGSFRLTETTSNDVGDYCLVPADGLESDDFRLVMIDRETNIVELLQADPEKGGQFRLVEHAKYESGEFRLVQAASRASERKRRPNSPTAGYALRDTADNITTAYRSTGQQTQHKTASYWTDSYLAKNVSSEDRYTVFHDVTDDGAPTEGGLFLPDMRPYDPPKMVAAHLKIKSKFNVEFNKNSDENEMSEFRAKYKDSYREASSENLDRLLQHGFRRGSHDVAANTLPQTAENGAVNHGDYTGADWRTHNFDSWSRTTDTRKRHSTNLDRSSQQVAKTSPEEQEGSLLDEVKLRANYKQWRKSHITAIRMRKELPASDRSAVCVTLRDNAISHDQLKQMVEKATSCTLTSLQFDPVSVHSLDKDVRSQWILRFDNPSVCETLITSGLFIEGKQYPVRRFDDVVKEEHEAYTYFLLLEEIKRTKAEKRDRCKNMKTLRKLNKKVSASHTQTPVVGTFF